MGIGDHRPATTVSLSKVKTNTSLFYNISAMFGGLPVLGPATPVWVLLPFVYLLTFVLNGAWPGTRTAGYVLDRSLKQPLWYHLNGFRVAVTVYVLALVAAASGHLDLTLFVRQLQNGAAPLMACVLGMACAVAFFARGMRRWTQHGLHASTGLGLDARTRWPTVDQAGKVAPVPTDAETREFHARTRLEHFWAGLEWNPRVVGVDIKMYLYLIGAVYLQLNLLSGLAYQSQQAAAEMIASGGTPRPPAWAPLALRAVFPGPVSYALLVYVGALSWFLTEYLYNEHVHLYTYDLFRERIGFKLLWGCVCFYPNFYCVGILPLLQPPAAGTDLSPTSCAACVAVFLLGWTLTRGANLQKYYAKLGERKVRCM